MLLIKFWVIIICLLSSGIKCFLVVVVVVVILGVVLVNWLFVFSILCILKCIVLRFWLCNIWVNKYDDKCLLKFNSLFCLVIDFVFFDVRFWKVLSVLLKLCVKLVLSDSFVKIVFWMVIILVICLLCLVVFKLCLYNVIKWLVMLVLVFIVIICIWLLV